MAQSDLCSQGRASHRMVDVRTAQGRPTGLPASALAHPLLRTSLRPNVYR
jgi:hypothetical protein